MRREGGGVLKCQVGSLVRFVPEFIMLEEKRDCLKAESSYYRTKNTIHLF